MNPSKKLLIALLCFACTLYQCVESNAQVVAGISANGREMVHGDTINVCRGSTITYESTARGTTAISWKFNSGTPGSMPGTGPFSITYSTNGYDTTFQKVGSGAFSDSMFIIVRVADEKPVAGYTFLRDNACGNENIQFTNTTVNGAPFRYFWYFGDNKTSTDESPSHQYLDAVGSGSQTFPVKLVVINANACVDSITHIVTIRKVPDASIANADGGVTVGTYKDTISFRTCNNEASYNFKFKNASSTLADNASYTVSWGDGSPDTTFTNWTDTIKHDFPSGLSTMTVSVTSNTGCIGIKKYFVYVGEFPYGTITNTGSSAICESESLNFNLSNTAGNSPGTSYIFYINDFTEGQFFQQPPPATITQRFSKNSCSFLSDDGTQVFSNALGAYLLVQNPCGVNSSSVVPIYVSGKPIPVIYASAPATCVNATVELINTSGFGNVITPTGGNTAICENKGKNVWVITPSTGYTIVTGNAGSLNGSTTNQDAWTDGSDSLNLRFTQPGTYTAKLYVGNEKCGMDSTVTTLCVRSAPQASFTMSQPNSCGPATVDFTNTSPGNTCDTTADHYLWSVTYEDPEACALAGEPSFSFVNGTTETSRSPSLSFTAAGRYIIRLQVTAVNSGAGCATATVTDTFYVKGRIKAIIPDLPAFCANNKINPSASITSCYSKGPLGYQWTFSNGTPAVSTDSLPGDISFDVAGDNWIRLIITDSSCMQSDTLIKNIMVNPLPATVIIKDSPVCSGETISLGGAAVAGVTYQWTPATGLSDPAGANPSVTLNYNGVNKDTVYTYYLNASQGAHCNKPDSVKITVNRLPVIAISPDAAQICSGDSIQLTATGADSYQWEPAASLNTSTAASVLAKPTATLVYTVTGNSAGCEGQQRITVDVKGSPISSFEPQSVVFCGTDTTLQFVAQTQPDGNGPITYRWFVNGSPEGSSASFTYHFQNNGPASREFVISLEAKNGNGCGQSAVTGKVMLNPFPTPSIQVSPSLVQQQPNYEFTFRDISPGEHTRGYTWTMGDRFMQIKQGKEISHRYEDTGTFKVNLQVTDFATGCAAEDFVQVTILHVPGYIQVPNAICPSCSNYNLRKFLPLATGLKKYRLSIYTTWGQKIFETTSLDAQGSPNVPWDGTLNGKPLQQDVYSWQIEGEFKNGKLWEGMIYPGKTKPVKTGFITIIK